MAFCGISLAEINDRAVKATSIKQLIWPGWLSGERVGGGEISLRRFFASTSAEAC